VSFAAPVLDKTYINNFRPFRARAGLQQSGMEGLIMNGWNCGWSAIWRRGRPFLAQEVFRVEIWKVLPILSNNKKG
jgi:hypothetical protein